MFDLLFLGLFLLAIAFLFPLAVYQLDKRSRMRDALTKNGTTALMYAAEHNDVSAVRSLLHNEVWVDARDKNGKTALYLAAEEGHNQVVRMLIDAGADLDAKSNDGRTPLWVAGVFKKDATIRILRRAGAKD